MNNKIELTKKSDVIINSLLYNFFHMLLIVLKSIKSAQLCEIPRHINDNLSSKVF